VDVENPELEIGVRAFRDDEFRRALLSDPAGTLAREYGVKVPDGVTLQVHEETDTLVHLIIPGRPSRLEGLSDKDLEMLPQNPIGVSGCCTCGSTTQQTLSTLQAACCA
jgi:hypothetical protein